MVTVQEAKIRNDMEINVKGFLYKDIPLEIMYNKITHMYRGYSLVSDDIFGHDIKEVSNKVVKDIESWRESQTLKIKKQQESSI